jgi:glycosyltransferase involved in cell wall biosynthesis
MKSEASITCVIPTFRRPQLLGRAIKSVLDQSFTNFKICVYDNASGDETIQVVESLAAQDPRVHYYCHRENIGLQENFIYGLSKADTPFVHLISDDDFLLPGFYARAVEALQVNSGAAFYSGGILSAQPDGQVRYFLRYGVEGDQVYGPPDLFHFVARSSRTWTAAMFRRDVVERVGGLKKETGYSFDLDLILRAAARFEAVLSDAPYGVFVMHLGSRTTAEASEAFESELNLAYFASVNQAITSAVKDNAVTQREADGMKQLIHSLTEQHLFHGAFASIARQNPRGAHRASEILSEHFERNDLAAVIAAATSDSHFAAVIRRVLRCGNGMRKAWLARKRRGEYAVYSQMVRQRMLALAS